MKRDLVYLYRFLQIVLRKRCKFKGKRSKIKSLNDNKSFYRYTDTTDKNV